MNLLEILNAYPGETFIREHGKAIVARTDIQLSWAYTQTDRTGEMPPPFEGLQHCFAIPNFNRMRPLHKAGFRLQYAPLPWENAKKKAVLRAVAKVRPDCIHFQFAGTAIQWAWVAEELQVPFSFSIRGSDVQVAPFTMEGYLSKLRETGTKAAGIHAVCEALKNQFCHLSALEPDKVQVIRTAIHSSWSSIEPRQEKGFLLSVGRLHWRKGYPDLLLAARQLKKEGLPFQWSIIGEGPERPRLEYMIRDLDLNKQVVLEGQKSHAEMRRYFSRAHALVLTSIAEGFPNVVAEAMLAGLPVVSSDCGGVSEVLTHEKQGLLFPAGDVESMTRQLRIALQGDLSGMAAAGREQALHYFDARSHAQAFVSMLKNSFEPA